MENLNNFYMEIKPIVHTYVFELKKQWKKFIGFIIIIILILFLLSYLPFAAIPDNPMPDTQSEYFKGELGLFYLIIIFAVCLFFSGIICSEFSEKTGFVVFPKINKYKLMIGKYFSNLTLVIGIASIYYIVLGLFGYHFYEEPIVDRYFLSFRITLLYILAISSFITLFSSFMKNVNLTIVATIVILVIGFQIVDQFVVLSNPDFEPLYSLDYMRKLIQTVLLEDFPETTADRYTEIEFEDFTLRIWTTPTVEVGVIVLFLYTIICLVIASVIFARRQL